MGNESKNRKQEKLDSQCIGYDDIASNKDALGADKYYDGLAKFIKNCKTPMTISVQGDWGTGKTTALKIIEKKLNAESNDVKCHVIWFQTWQYALFGMDDNLMLALFSRLYSKLEEIAGSDTNSKPFPWKNILREATAGFVDNRLGGESASKARTLMNSLLGMESMDSVTEEIEKTKERIQAIIHSIIKEQNERIVIFIDDLDRLEPVMAINLLEAIKNFLDCEKCVFVLALDASVVYQGVKAKYGDIGGKDKEKKFFDKIIQVPFRIPVEQYDINNYLKSFLVQEKDETIERFAKSARLVLGNNPRSIKRVFNLFELHKIILNDLVKDEDSKVYLFDILLINTMFEKQYSNMVFAAKDGGIDGLYQLIQNDENYRMQKAILDMPENEKQEHEEQESEENQKWNLLGNILLGTSDVSSDGNENLTSDENGNSTKLDVLKQVISFLETKGYTCQGNIYLQMVVNDKAGKKIATFRNRGASFNLVIYDKEKKPLKAPDSSWINGEKQDAEKMNEIHYLTREDQFFITFPNIPYDISVDKIYEVFRYYGYLE